MDLFDVYFRRADLDQDGRISGAEAVAFFQGSNLSKTVLAQIWMHADQNRTGFLGRPEFYNALKLVTVAQSKRELTPDMVKAALYGHASAQIPAPQINLNAIPTPQLNSPAASSLQTTATQNLGFRGQVPPNSSVNQQYFPSQGNHPARPPLPMTGGPASRPPLGLSNSNISSDSFGGLTGGAPSGAMPQVPSRGVSQLMPSVGPRPQVVLPTSSLTVTKDSKALVGSGNGFSSDSMFGGDVFSATSELPKHDSSVPTFSASGLPASSAIVPVSTASQSSVKPDPLDSLQSSFMRQSTGGQLQQTQSQFKPKQHIPSQSTSSVAFSSVEVGNSSSNQSQLPWPKMTPAGVQKYAKVFVEVDSDKDGKITGEQARNLFLSWRLPREILKQVWDLSDQDNDSMLSLREFCIALYLMERYREGRPLPTVLPSNILLDENLLSLTGQPNASYANTAWGPPAGMRPQPGMPGAQTMAPATGLRPPMPTVFGQADGGMQFNQHKARVPLMENSHMNQLSNGDQNPLNFVPQQEAETDAKVGDKAKVLLDSKEKIEFYRTKMQDLVLYKSRCDNRLNEITERALADKREAELLAKKYEEKYKQVAEIASKLTIEEASFRDIQERKMELNQAIIKMEQGGSVDGILQVRADRIQSNLEDLMRALTERCKKHGKHVKSAALIELPIGWQPGVPEVSAVWDEDWDKFEDEGFSFDVKPSNVKSASVQKENSSTNDTLSPDSLSHADGKSDELFNRSVLESESAYTHSEDESAKSPGGSPVRQTAFESPSQEYSNNHFRKSSEADTETHRSFDEPNWGTFDNNDDTDSVWGFNPSSARDSDHEKHGEKYFFGSDDFGASPIRTDSPQKRIPFAFEDSVPSTPLSRADNSSPRYSMGPADPFFDNISRFDSFKTSDQGFSPRGETFTRFDSINSTRGFDHSRGISSFDDADPFGSTGPFKVSSSESQTPRKGSENWGAF